MCNKIRKPAFVDWGTFYSDFIKPSEAFKKQSGSEGLFWMFVSCLYKQAQNVLLKS